MLDQELESQALRLAELRSERVRILGLLAFIAIFCFVLAFRHFLFHTTLYTAHTSWNFGLSFMIAVYEYLMLRLVDRAISKGEKFPKSLWVSSTILETCIPAIGIAWQSSVDLPAVYRPIASPATLLFFIFIILSILRLNPWICWLSGVTASLSYLAAAVYLGWRPPVPGTPAPITQTDVSLYAAIVLLSGLIAGGVAGEIRKYVQAALREAETKQQLRRLHHDLEIARDIQQALLPKDSPKIEGYYIAGWNKPAEETGGDYYDWTTFSDGRLIVSLADVTGHGIGPAMLAGVCRAYSRTNFRSHRTLFDAFRSINAAIARDLDPGRFITFVGVACTPGTGDLEVLSAGHGPLFRYSAANDTFTEVDSQGVPLGVLPEFTSAPSTPLHLEPDDLFLLVTDGFVEWENPKMEEFGAARLKQAIRASRNLSPDKMLTALYEAVLSFSSGTKQQDDLTAVIIKRT
ncbi:MAG TPA: PP2C family protein-serine/threonine phosphatase [Candidatus Acidoferrum sp.]|nr:PP2C family protein-serine/threonine phosphatase [Candidatus Acidoferrum sp.]